MSEPEDQQKYIRRLELTLKKMNREKKELEKQNEELREKCAKQYADMQKLVRYELKLESKEVKTAMPV